jgi:hypothetical protein
MTFAGMTHAAIKNVTYTFPSVVQNVNKVTIKGSGSYPNGTVYQTYYHDGQTVQQLGSNYGSLPSTTTALSFPNGFLALTITYDDAIVRY